MTTAKMCCCGAISGFRRSLIDEYAAATCARPVRHVDCASTVNRDKGHTMNHRADLLRSARKRHQMTCLQVAMVTQLDPSRISHIENGRRPATEATIRRYLGAGLITREEAINALVGPDDAEAVGQ